MDTAWIQVFVLTLAECVAPSGKTVCQESQFELQFLTRNDCEYALQQLVALKSRSEDVIVDETRSGCSTTTREKEIFSSKDAATASLSGQQGWRPPESAELEPSRAQVSHDERLESLKSCEETGGVAPCKMGEIIIEGAAEQVEVWRRDQ